MAKYEIELYSKENGEEPVREFILELKPKIQAKIYRADYERRLCNG